jgi:hypothetical protein
MKLTRFEVGQGVEGGGLMEFGPSQSRMAPVEEPTVYELVINLRAARTMGLLRADRVIE